MANERDIKHSASFGRCAPVEVELVDTRAPSVEILILWGASVLHVAHLAPPRSFHVGDDRRCDCLLPSALLGTRRAPVVLVDRRGAVWLLLLPRATGSIELAGQPAASLRASLDQGSAQRHDEIEGAYRVPLPPGSKATIEIGGFVIQVANGYTSRLNIGSLPHAQPRGARRSLGASLALHAGLFLAAALGAAPLHEAPADMVLKEQPYVLQQYLITAAEPEEDDWHAEQVAERAPDGEERSDSRCGELRGGSMGKPTAAQASRRYGIQGPTDNPDPHLARASYTYASVQLSWTGPPQSDVVDNGDTPVVPWGREDALGNDRMSARGRMWGDDYGETFGSPGAGLGRHRLCETCGDTGAGVALGLGTSAGGAPGR